MGCIYSSHITVDNRPHFTREDELLFSNELIYQQAIIKISRATSDSKQNYTDTGS
jgi:hypothetical protein